MSTQAQPVTAWENVRALWEGGARMARREFQAPSVLQRVGVRGEEWYCRYRVKVLEMQDGKPVVRRVDIKTTQLYIADDAQRRAVAVGNMPRLALVKKGA
jgi:hypothetical protein